MRTKIRFLIASIISIMPFSAFRIFLYKLIFKYNINNSQIGFGTIIDIKKCFISGAKIGNFNIFTGPFVLEMNSGSFIGFGNTFRCGKWILNSEFKYLNFKHSLVIGKNSSIDNKHYFDISGLIKIGEKSFISGNGSQFWTHGGDKIDNDIIIGDNCYIGSGVKFAPGSLIANNSIVSLGSIITRKFKKENSLISPPAMRVMQFEPDKNPLFN